MNTTNQNETLAALLEGVAAERNKLSDDEWTDATYRMKLRALEVFEGVVRSAIEVSGRRESVAHELDVQMMQEMQALIDAEK